MNQQKCKSGEKKSLTIYEIVISKLLVFFLKVNENH